MDLPGEQNHGRSGNRAAHAGVFQVRVPQREQRAKHRREAEVRRRVQRVSHGRQPQDGADGQGARRRGPVKRK